MKIPQDHTPNLGFFKFSNDNCFKRWVSRYQHGFTVGYAVGLHSEFRADSGYYNASHAGFYGSINHQIVTIVNA
ncbi:hypothetical protein SRABI111_00295 [Pseudomonas carnis]|nr:hypothetical protein SRABI111_00295 [Pseudomonas carnis]CAH0137170.1 hypothetical protein SRABI110_00439 [Pseudomonas carnis]CAH0159955.1 hypothetical protein SRABI64_00753 [Pseudomonas carnis]CAH0200172.1 hypothetical protein SRABI08_01873 [Pseudomonas carnis]